MVHSKQIIKRTFVSHLFDGPVAPPYGERSNAMERVNPYRSARGSGMYLLYGPGAPSHGERSNAMENYSENTCTHSHIKHFALCRGPQIDSKGVKG